MTAARLLAASLAAVGVLASAAAGQTADSLPVWGSVPSANRGDLQNTLLGVSIVSPTDTWAVGEYNPGVPPTQTGRRTLAEHSDGGRFRLVASPNPHWTGVDLARLEAVDAVSSTDVWAVGHADDFASLRSTTLTEHWDGTSWQIVRSPNPGGSDRPNRLFDVAAVATDDVWAVGDAGYPERALTIHWDGTRWAKTANTCGVPLRGVTAAGSGLWAVGDNTTCFFDGSRWTVVPSPQPRGGYSELAYELEGVSASAANDVWAVGARVLQNGESVAFAPLAEHWDGSRWTAFFALDGGQSLSNVTALSPGNAWAVGTTGAVPLILHWDGTAWQRVPTPGQEQAGGITAIDAFGSTLEAVGSASPSGSQQRTYAAQAPSTTQGQVIGHTNVADATVSWFGHTSGSTATDDLGNYSIAALPAGTYTITASFAGCRPASASVRVDAGTSVTLDLQISC